jgi:hypothetical protein
VGEGGGGPAVVGEGGWAGESWYDALWAGELPGNLLAVDCEHPGMVRIQLRLSILSKFQLD